MEQRVEVCAGPSGEQIAYGVVGEGPVLVLAAWWTSHLELDWQNDELRNFVEDLARNHTVVRYDRPGVGMSDRGERAYGLETEVGHLQSVIDAVGADTVDLLGISCGGPPCVELAARHPELVRRLVFFGSYAEGRQISTPETRAAIRALVEANWGLGSRALAGVFLPDSDSPTARRFSRDQRHTANAEVAANLLQLTFDMDVSGSTAAVGQPSLVLHRRHDQVIEAHLGRDLAERLPEAEFRELDGSAHQPWGEHQGDVVAAIEEFLTDGTATAPATRHLATVVFLDIVDSTAQMSGLGDQPWRSRLDALHGLIEREAASRGGTVVKDTGDGAMLSFGLPGDALAFATTIRRRAAALDLTLRVGVHSGEVEQRGDDITGRTVVVASRLCDLAPPGRVYLSATTSDLAAGRGAKVREVGSRELKGIPDPVTVLEADPDAVATGGTADGGSTPTFVRSGSVWTVSFDGSEVTVPHTKGVADLASLCRSPDIDIDVVTLMDGPDAPPRTTGDEILDRHAIASFRTRLGDIEGELDEADLAGDVDRSRRLDDERAALINELKAASGLGDRTRRMGDEVERARKAVSGRVRSAIATLADANPALGAHLSEHVSTGRVCRYGTR